MALQTLVCQYATMLNFVEDIKFFKIDFISLWPWGRIESMRQNTRQHERKLVDGFCGLHSLSNRGNNFDQLARLPSSAMWV